MKSASALRRLSYSDNMPSSKTLSSSRDWTLAGRWVFPVDQGPIEWGVITIRGAKIVAVEPRGHSQVDVDLGNVAILPGLVNAHTHLDLTGLRGSCRPSEDFTAWLREVIWHRRNRKPRTIEGDIRDGIAECIRYGTTLIGDIADQGRSWQFLADSPIRAVVFYEQIGLPCDRADQAMRTAEEWLRKARATSICRPALSPHAPYSVRTTLFEEAGLLAKRKSLAVAVHVAESCAEHELLDRHDGPFRKFLESLGAWDPEGLVRDERHLFRLLAPAAKKLIVHANYLCPNVKLPDDSTIVYCPRTHAAFGHAKYPLPELLKRGRRVALGTDSLASNPSLDVLAEARFVHKTFPAIPGDAILRMATLSGAEALGWESETGSLSSGKSADLAVVALPDAKASDPHTLLLGSTELVQRSMCCGLWL